MANINVVGDFHKSGLTKVEIEKAVKAVFDTLDKAKKINIAFVDAREIQKQNLKYRKIDKPTDVLSFDYEDEGDILLHIDLIDEFKETSEKLSDAILKTLIHGSLHLFGYDHENKKDYDIMKKTEDKVWEEISK